MPQDAGCRNRKAAAAIQVKKRIKVVRAPFCLLTDGGLISVGQFHLPLDCT